MITQTRLKNLLDYDPETGIFTWVKSRPGCKPGAIAGCNTGSGYQSITVDYKAHQSHRLAWLYVHGCVPVDEIDHINQNRSDNRIENLREVDHGTNQRNQKKHNDNTSGIPGVTWHKRGRSWQAQIQIEGKLKYLGLYKCKEEAHQRRREAEKEYNFHENHGRDHTCST